MKINKKKNEVLLQRMIELLQQTINETFFNLIYIINIYFGKIRLFSNLKQSKKNFLFINN
jgi:hypothetical protein